MLFGLSFVDLEKDENPNKLGKLEKQHVRCY
jgi:hypothetical protein